MDDLTFRLAIVAVVLAITLGIAWYRQRMARRPGRRLSGAGLAPGLHYFSSQTCDTCHSARALLDRRVGETGYTEHSWEEETPIFTRLGVDEVPALVVVEEDGTARLYAGRFETALRGR